MNRVVSVAMYSLCRTVVCALLVGGWAQVACAQAGHLDVQVRTPSGMPRSNAPVEMLLEMTWQGQGLLEGYLNIEVHGGGELLNRIRTTDLALTNGAQQFSGMLPVIPSTYGFEQIELRMKFVSEHGEIELQTQLLRAHTMWRRSLTVCYCDPFQQKNPQLNALTDCLRFERLHPHPEKNDALTISAHVTPDEMPDEPLRYCAYNLVVLSPAGFAALRPRVLEALLKWIHAGGSLCVMVGGPMSGNHVAFLNNLAGKNEADSNYLLDSNGNLQQSAGAVVSRKRGLGRVVIVETAAERPDDFTSPTWLEAAAFLWKIRQDQIASVSATGTWSDEIQLMLMADVKDTRDRRFGSEQQAASTMLAFTPLRSGQILLERLLPHDIRAVPLTVVATVLFVYVLLIGPGDYFILGALKRRRLTWIVFPTVTVVFAWLTLLLSNYYMKSNQPARAVEFVDIGENSGIVRKNRFELQFPSVHSQVTTKVRRALFVPMNHQLFSNMGWEMQAYRGNAGGELVGPASYNGRYPYVYSVTQNIPQWTPQLNRLFSIAPDDELPKFDWNQFDFDTMQTPAGRELLGKQIIAAFGVKSSAFIFNRAEYVRILGREAMLDQRAREFSPRYTAKTFLQEACVRQPGGLFSVISQLSPTGGDNFEDLTILDPSNGNELLLIICIDRGGDVIVYRKLYTEAT